MACGVPCVSTEVGDARWLLGGSGELAARGDADGLADAMVRMQQRIEREGTQAGAVARQRIVEEFSIAALVRRTEEALCGISGLQPVEGSD
jgi:glycosyltransferase involved in cell wall biosynthesis